MANESSGETNKGRLKQNADDILRDILSSKLEGHSTPAPPELWSKISSGSSAAAGGSSWVSSALQAKWRIAAVAVVTAVIVSVYVFQNDKEQAVNSSQHEQAPVNDEQNPVEEQLTVTAENVDSDSPEEERDPVVADAPLSTEKQGEKQNLENTPGTSVPFTKDEEKEEIAELPEEKAEIGGKQQKTESVDISAENVAEQYGQNPEELIVSGEIGAERVRPNDLELDFALETQYAERISWLINGDIVEDKAPNERLRFVFKKEGHQTVEAVVHAASGGNISRKLELEVWLPTEIVLPNVFSPGTSPGYNDYYGLNTEKSRNVASYVLKIFDQQGVLIFESAEDHNSWDGNDRYGNPVSTGTYVAVIDAIGKDGKRITKQQTLYLKR